MVAPAKMETKPSAGVSAASASKKSCAKAEVFIAIAINSKGVLLCYFLFDCYILSSG
jgi:hypothetical protein